MEKWKAIPEYEGIYEASDLGKIRTADGKTTWTDRHGARHWKQRILKQKWRRRQNGRRSDARVCLWKDGTDAISSLYASGISVVYNVLKDM